VAFHRDENGGFVYRGEYHQRERPPEGDVAVCFSGAVAISKILV
jgi:hypothetical protein